MIAGPAATLPGPPLEGTIRVQPRRHPARIVGGLSLLLVLLAILRSVVANPNFQWQVVGEYLFAGIILQGLATTLALTGCTMLIGIAGGTVLALMRQADNPITASFASAYIWLFRGTPLLVQLLFWYNLAALYPVYRFGIPWLAPDLWHGSVNDLITPYSAAILGPWPNSARRRSASGKSGVRTVRSGR